MERMGRGNVDPLADFRNRRLAVHGQIQKNPRGQAPG